MPIRGKIQESPFQKETLPHGPARHYSNRAF